MNNLAPKELRPRSQCHRNVGLAERQQAPAHSAFPRLFSIIHVIIHLGRRVAGAIIYVNRLYLEKVTLLA
jgi:hypothetical protein